MDNQISNYKDRDIVGAIDSFKIVERKAKTTGNPYLCLELKLVNGFTKLIFFNRGEEFAFVQAIESI